LNDLFLVKHSIFHIWRAF